jgi:hypothetical protein
MSHFFLQNKSNMNRVKICSLFKTTSVNNFKYVAAEKFLNVKQLLGTKRPQHKQLLKNSISDGSST